MPPSATYRPATPITALGPAFFDVVTPATFPEHRLRYRNQRWADRIGLGGLTDDEWRGHFAEFRPLPDNLPNPLALRYHGHQFQTYNPDLGDGRGFLFAQIYDAADGRLLDLGTKGSGRTPWSREGDGRLTLKGGVREILATEMLEALGVYTSKSFSLFETGERLYRNDEPSPTRSSVLVRLSHSHLRIGSFQRHAFHRDTDNVRVLLDFVVEHYLPELTGAPLDDTPAAVVRAMAHRCAELCASWMVAGFVHGVLNSDNINLTGESFDYGPWRFLPAYDPQFTAAYFDHSGLYAFGRQPATVLWNLERLADAVSSLTSTAALTDALREFAPAFQSAMQRRLLARLGLASRGAEDDEILLRAVFGFLQESQVGYDQFFFDWYGGGLSRLRASSGPAASLYTGARFERLRDLLGPYAPTTPDRLALPYFQRPRPCSMLIGEVEAIWAPIADDDDWSRFEQKLRDIAEMNEALALQATPFAPTAVLIAAA